MVRYDKVQFSVSWTSEDFISSALNTTFGLSLCLYVFTRRQQRSVNTQVSPRPPEFTSVHVLVKYYLIYWGDDSEIFVRQTHLHLEFSLLELQEHVCETERRQLGQLIRRNKALNPDADGLCHVRVFLQPLWVKTISVQGLFSILNKRCVWLCHRVKETYFMSYVFFSLNVMQWQKVTKYIYRVFLLYSAGSYFGFTTLQTQSSNKNTVY